MLFLLNTKFNIKTNIIAVIIDAASRANNIPIKNIPVLHIKNDTAIAINKHINVDVVTKQRNSVVMIRDETLWKKVINKIKNFLFKLKKH